MTYNEYSLLQIIICLISVTIAILFVEHAPYQYVLYAEKVVLVISFLFLVIALPVSAYLVGLIMKSEFKKRVLR